MVRCAANNKGSPQISTSVRACGMESWYAWRKLDRFQIRGQISGAASFGIPNLSSSTARRDNMALVWNMPVLDLGWRRTQEEKGLGLVQTADFREEITNVPRPRVSHWRPELR
jgi:hypothetical protein